MAITPSVRRHQLTEGFQHYQPENMVKLLGEPLDFLLPTATAYS